MKALRLQACMQTFLKVPLIMTSLRGLKSTKQSQAITVPPLCFILDASQSLRDSQVVFHVRCPNGTFSCLNIVLESHLWI